MFIDGSMNDKTYRDFVMDYNVNTWYTTAIFVRAIGSSFWEEILLELMLITIPKAVECHVTRAKIWEGKEKKTQHKETFQNP